MCGDKNKKVRERRSWRPKQEAYVASRELVIGNAENLRIPRNPLQRVCIIRHRTAKLGQKVGLVIPCYLFAGFPTPDFFEWSEHGEP